MLDICEIFVSIQGEGWRQGISAVFIRFYGCNLRCKFCDTRVAFTKKQSMDEKEIVEIVRRLSRKYNNITNIIITGGEPYLQDFSNLVLQLKLSGFFVCVETNGTIWREIPLDWICVSPKKSAKKLLQQGYDKRFKDVANEFKYVITGKHDFSFIDSKITKPVILQPVNNDLKIALMIFKQIKKCSMPNWFLRFQIHKLMGIL
ncbi:MAG TPA: 7-carboxy-7-deazaguanine synthase QueE [bacterium]|jgi:organic radical activating enzyme|nr:7-carboxy-7-deazaguanine synthase QueE [bacterium]